MHYLSNIGHFAVTIMLLYEPEVNYAAIFRKLCFVFKR